MKQISEMSYMEIVRLWDRIREIEEAVAVRGCLSDAERDELDRLCGAAPA